jgi:hypothetical protein
MARIGIPLLALVLFGLSAACTPSGVASPVGPTEPAREPEWTKNAVPNKT